MKSEKKFLQSVVMLACVVPIYGGLLGVLNGVQFQGIGGVDLDNHFRYLSGVLLGIGLAFLSSIPNIELHSKRFQLLTFVVVSGGLGRLLGFYLKGLPSSSMLFALMMELVITPLLCFWQLSLTRRIVLVKGSAH
ncbi:MAG: DUF4345 domain-containing protein [Tatlockia sp.]|nr:DUF4345 domain-containing protein [Tatlockia sp.]